MPTTNITWDTLTEQYKNNAVPAVRSLRNRTDVYFQYYQHDGREAAAVRTLKPYGVISIEALQEANELPLLHVIEQGSDWSALEIPSETIALKAATLGTGWRRAQLMEPVYERVGRSIAALHQLMSTPDLTLSDVAMRRDTGEVLFVPPIAFKAIESNQAVSNVDQFVASVNQELCQMFNPEMIACFGRAVVRGYEG